MRRRAFAGVVAVAVAIVAACSSFEPGNDTPASPDAGADGATPKDDAASTGDASSDVDVDAAPAASTAYRAEVLLDTPIAYWRFNEKAGSPSHPSEVGPHVLVPGAKPALSGYAGLFSGTGGAIGFTATDGERVVSSTAPTIVPSAVAIEVWVYLDIASDDNSRFIAARSNGTQAFLLYVLSGVAWIEIADATIDSGTPTSYVGASGITPGKWHHILAQATGPTQVEIFGDGVRYTNIGQAINGPYSTRDLSIGAADDLGKTLGTGGKIAEVALYDHLLVPQRVTAHYLAGRAQ
jgi:hypothetical protein